MDKRKLGNLSQMRFAKEITIDELKLFVKLLCPFAPHLAEELWARLGEKELVSLSAWPVYDEAKTVDDTVVIALQVIGKTKDTVSVPKDCDEDTAFAAAMTSEKFAALVNGKTIVKKIFVKNKIFNVIVK
jgi:leucyl-tRNA synthetase